MSNIEVIPTGSTLFDLALNGGYAGGRLICLFGMESTGKTLCAIEACAQFMKLNPNGKILYIDTETAFDPDYATVIGFPADKVELVSSVEQETPIIIEEVAEKLEEFMSKLEDAPGLVILDSLDATPCLLDLDDTTKKPANKASFLSKWLPKLTSELARSRTCFFVIQQQRANLNMTGNKWAPKTVETGGTAIKFYASQRIELTRGQKDKDEKGEDSHVSGIDMKVNVVKNKIGIPFQRCNVPIRFSYGINDIDSCLEYLADHKRIDTLSIGKGLKSDSQAAAYSRLLKLPEEEQRLTVAEIREATKLTWELVKQQFNTPLVPKHF